MNGSDGELSLSMNTLKNQIGFSPRSPSSLGMGSDQGIGTTSRDDGRQGGSKCDAQYYNGPKFPYDSDDQVYNKRLNFIIPVSFLVLNTNKLLYTPEWRFRKSSSYTISSLEFAKKVIEDVCYGEFTSISRCCS